MQVRALVSFAGNFNEKTYSISLGEIFELPEGTDWLKAKFVELVEPTVTEQPVIAENKAVVRKRK